MLPTLRLVYQIFISYFYGLLLGIINNASLIYHKCKF